MAQFVAEGGLIRPLTSFLAAEALAATGAIHGSHQGESMYGRTRSGSSFRSGPSRKRQKTSLRGARRVVHFDDETSYPTPRDTTKAPTIMVTRPGLRTRTRATRYRSQLGRRVGKYSTRKTNTQVSWALIDSLGTKVYADVADKKFASARLINIPFNSNEENINTRKGNIVNVRGVKIRLWWQLNVDIFGNNLTTPLQVRWCILNPKKNTGVQNLDLDDFFIDTDPTDNITAPFLDGGNADSFYYMNRKINREQFGVVKQGTFVLNNNRNGGYTNNSVHVQLSPSAYKKVSCYIPINRQMVFATNGAVHPEQNLYFCWWYCRLGDPALAQAFVEGTPEPQTDGTVPLQCRMEKITYFRNSQMFN